MSRNCEPDDMVSSFSQFITDRANPYFEKHSSERSNSYFYHENKTKKQKWYTDECRRRRQIYKEAMYNYNLNRNNDTRKLMLDAKRTISIFAGHVNKSTVMSKVGKRMNYARVALGNFGNNLNKRKSRRQNQTYQLKIVFNTSDR